MCFTVSRLLLYEIHFLLLIKTKQCIHHAGGVLGANTEALGRFLMVVSKLVCLRNCSCVSDFSSCGKIVDYVVPVA